jgi:hypothetical protein
MVIIDKFSWIIMDLSRHCDKPFILLIDADSREIDQQA